MASRHGKGLHTPKHTCRTHLQNIVTKKMANRSFYKAPPYIYKGENQVPKGLPQ